MYENISKTENISTFRVINSTLLKGVLFHSRTCGRPNDTVTSSLMTKSRSSLIGLSKEISFVSKSHVANNMLYNDTNPLMYSGVI